MNQVTAQIRKMPDGSYVTLIVREDRDAPFDKGMTSILLADGTWKDMGDMRGVAFTLPDGFAIPTTVSTHQITDVKYSVVTVKVL